MIGKRIIKNTVSALLLCAVSVLTSCGAVKPAETETEKQVTALLTVTEETERSAPDTIPDIWGESTTGCETGEDTESETTTDPPPETTGSAFEETRITFRGFGDNLVYRSTFVQSLKDDKTYDFKPKYEGVKDLIESVDIAYVNQETPMCGEKYGYSGYPHFNGPNEMGVNLVELGFDVIGFANNHVTDMAKEHKTSVSEMIDFTDTLDALIIGLHRDEDDFERIRVYECKGVKIAFLAYTYGTNWFAQECQPERVVGAYIPVYDEEKITRQITKAKEIADVIAVTIHWGKENSFVPNAEQTYYAQLMADLGADVIIGHHPHVVQKIEWIDGKDGHKTLCYYSLGNGLNAQDKLNNMVGITADFEIVQSDSGVHIENASCTPIFNVMEPGYKDIHLIKLCDLTEDIAKKHHCNKTDRTVTVEKAYRIVTDHINREFLPDYLFTE